MPLERGLIVEREEVLRPPPWPFAFNHSVDGDLADLDRPHCSFLPGLSIAQSLSVMRDPRAVQRLFNAAVAGPDHVRRHGADKRIERLRADRIDHTLPDLLWIEARGGEAFGQHRLVIRSDLRPTHMVRS